jgi:hypothetical protein
LEISIPFIYPLLNKRDFNKKRLQQRIYLYSDDNEIELIQRFTEANYIANKALHPYLGFVHDTNAVFSQRSEYFGFGNDKEILNNFGNTVKIVMTGGSFAQGLYYNAKDIIINALKKSHHFAGKNIKMFNLAIGGYKQPQQLLALNYFIMLGGKFDIWINLDGFNEITLPVSENWKNKVASFYPRLWNLYARKSLDKNTIDKMVEIKAIRSSRKKFNSFFSNKFISESSFFLYIWEIFDQKLSKKEYTLNKDLFKIISLQEPTYQVTGPVSVNKHWQQILNESVNIWKRSSSLMEIICRENGIKYFHFLQPNQYLRNSKYLTKEERFIAYEEGPYDYRVLVESGYPLLINTGVEMKKSGILFFDLTMIFKEENRTIYSDKCCHVNKLGYEIVADEISKVIIQNYLSKSSSRGNNDN